MSDTAKPKIPQLFVKASDQVMADQKVALWERHSEHPHEDFESEGEIFIPHDKANTPVKVAKTNQVMDRLRAGVLVEVTDADAGKPQNNDQVTSPSSNLVTASTKGTAVKDTAKDATDK